MGFIGRKVIVVALLIGTIGGFASGFHSMRRHHAERRAAFERHVAELCVDAAARQRRRAAAPEE
jgi:hypothetical protein